MGVVKLNKAEVYSVRLSEGSPIFTGGTDNAQSTAHFNNNVQISASNGTGILTVIETGTSEIKLQKDDARTTPAFKITNTDTTAEADA
jgi:predicted aspartyl protease